jgi:hypothetical protein
MKTAKEVLSENLKYCTPLCDGWDDVIESVLKAMESYATEREAKYRELYEAMRDLIKLYGGRLSDHAVYLSIHGIEETEGNIKLGELFRQHITELEQELGLNKE